MIITRSEIMQHSERWLHYFWGGEEIFRELQPYGNRDARFKIGAEIGYVHLDQFNAINQPIGHLAKWLHEKTGINEGLLRLIGYGITAYGLYKIGKNL